MLADRNLAQLSPARLHPAAKGDKCRDPQPNIRWCRRTVVAERGPEGSRTPQEDQQRKFLLLHNNRECEGEKCTTTEVMGAPEINEERKTGGRSPKIILWACKELSGDHPEFRAK